MIIFTAGSFGAQVGERLAQLRGAKVLPLRNDRELLREQVREASFVAVAAWRPHVLACELIDDLCFETRVPWSLAEINGQRLSCGPLVRPGEGACYHCYRRRWLSHNKAPEREQVLQQAYDHDDTLGPAGFIGPMVEIAAQSLAGDASASSAEAGRLRLVDVLNGAVLESAVIGVHECPRCRPRASTRPGDRFVRTLVPEFERLVSGVVR
ncbi:MAG: TOMM precursor leader peptide-binding protein [Rhodanobacter sp.]